MIIKMDLFKVGRKGDKYVKDDYSAEEKNGTLKYWIWREGWKRTKVFTRVTVEFNIESMVDIGKYASEYGIDIGTSLAESYKGCCLETARHHAILWRSKYEKCLKDIDLSKVSKEVIDMIQYDSFFPFIIDIVSLEDKLHEADPEFDPVNCTYKGQENVSTEDFVIEKYGKETAEFIKLMIRGKNEN